MSWVSSSSETNLLFRLDMSGWIRYINHLFDKKISGSGLALFRGVYGCVLLAESLQIFHYRHLIYDPIPYIEIIEFSFGALLTIWIFFILLFILGLFTRLATIMNYLFTLVVISSMGGFEYHLDYSLVSINFVLMFAPVSACWSLDRKWFASENEGKISVIYPYLLLFMGIGLVYFDSVFWKLSSPGWMYGLGVWKPAALPQMIHHNQLAFLDQYPAMLFLNYLTIAFEGVFLFIFRWKQARILILAIGLGLHLGIYIMFPIPLFAWGMISLYTLLIPISWIDRLGEWFNQAIQNSRRSLTLPFPFGKEFSISADGPLFGISQHMKVRICAVFILGVIGMSLINIAYHIPPFRLKAIPIIREKVGPLLSRLEQVSRQTMGITSHPVFMDSHFDRYNHIIGITYQGENASVEWLPIINFDGRAGEYLTGRIWVNWTWRVNAPDIDMERLGRGIMRYTAYWAFHNHVDLDETRFEVRVKKIKMPTSWEAGLLKQQMEQPWQDAGYVIWQDQKCIPFIKDIESL